MDTYKGLIIAVTLVLLGGAGYYFHSVGVTDLVTHDITSGGQSGKSYGVSAIEVFSGSYECLEKNGCKNTTRLILEDDTTLDLTAIIDGKVVNLGQGTWGIGTNGALVIVLQNSNPNAMIAKNISTLKISGFSTKKGLFPGMEDPTFTRINTVEPNSGDAQQIEK
jgi:hypothetical protein